MKKEEAGHYERNEPYNQQAASLSAQSAAIRTMEGSSVKHETPSPTDSTRQQLLPYRQYPAAHMSRPGCTTGRNSLFTISASTVSEMPKLAHTSSTLWTEECHDQAASSLCRRHT